MMRDVLAHERRDKEVPVIVAFVAAQCHLHACVACVALEYIGIKLLGEKRIGALPVIGQDGIAGIFSERDVIYCLRDHGAEVLSWPVSRIMSSPAITALRNLHVNPPTLKLISPMDTFQIIWMKLPILCAVFIASPWILYQVWAFIAPGLYKRERRWAYYFVGAAIPLVPAAINEAINGNVLVNQDRIALALGVEMILVVTIIMVFYWMVQRRARRWLQ